MTTTTVGSAPPAQRSPLREILGVLLITVGSIVPVIPWVVGIALVWASDRWRAWEKLLATLVWPLGYGPVLLVGLLPLQSCGSGMVDDGHGHVTTTTSCHGAALPEAAGLVVAALLWLAPLLVGGYLLVRARQRARLTAAG